MIVELDRVPRKTWNNALRQAGPQGTIFQSTYWADYLEKTLGDKPLWFAAFNKKGDIQGLLLAIESCYAKHTSLTSSNNFLSSLYSVLFRKVACPVLNKVLPCIFWENGPIILSEDDSLGSPLTNSLYQGLLSSVVAKAYRDNCYAIKFARPSFLDDPVDRYSLLGFENRKMGTMLIRLDEPEDVLWSRVDNQARRAVRRGNAQGIDVRKASKPEELQEFYDLTVQSSRRSNIKTYPFSFYISLWNHFSPLNKIAIFVARINDRPAATALLFMHNETAHVFTLADSDYARTNSIRANDVLIWHCLKWASGQGFRCLDFSGVQIHKIEAGDEKARGIFRFKAKWGGKLVEYHDYERVMAPRKLGFVRQFMLDSTIHN